MSAAKISNASCGEWAGGNSILVQMGDVADRGRDVQKANACLRRLQRRARGRRTRHKAGGQPRAHARRRITARRSSGRVQRRGGGRRHAVESGREERRRARLVFGRAHFSRTLGSGQRARAPPKVVDRRTGELPQRPPPRRRRRVSRKSRPRPIPRTRVSLQGRHFTAGIDRGGRGVGGTFWTDWRILEGAAGEALPDAVQIVGHSAARCRPRRGSPCEPIRFRSDLRAVVIDAGLSKAYASNRAYLEIDGSIYAHWLEADSSVWRRRDLAGVSPSRIWHSCDALYSQLRTTSLSPRPRGPASPGRRRRTPRRARRRRSPFPALAPHKRRSGPARAR